MYLKIFTTLQKLFLTHIKFIGWQVIFYQGHKLELEITNQAVKITASSALKITLILVNIVIVKKLQYKQ